MGLSATPDQDLQLYADFREFRIWDGDVVLYDSQSGNTHRLLHPAGLIIDALSRAERLSPLALHETCSSAHALDRGAFEQTLTLLIDLGVLAPS